MHQTPYHTPSEESTLLGDARRIFDRILVLVDFAVLPHATVGAALELRRALGSEVCLLALPELSGSDDFIGGIGSSAVIAADLAKETRGRLTRFLENVAPESCGKVELRARIGVDPMTCLRREAHRWDATVVIAAADSHGGILRSPAERIVRGFDLPLLLVPMPPPPPPV